MEKEIKYTLRKNCIHIDTHYYVFLYAYDKNINQ